MSKNILVVGANRGIGLELCRALAGRGDAVIAACRKASPDLNALAGVSVIGGVDVTDAASIAKLRAQVEGKRFDWLLVVAGVMRGGALASLEAGPIREQFEVNALGPLMTTVALLPSLGKGAKIGLLTSRMGSIADNTSGGSYGYRMSKAALNMAGMSLSHDLRGREIAVQLLHPGWVRTEMTGNTGNIDAAGAAAQLVARMDELTLAQSGRFVHANGEPLPW